MDQDKHKLSVCLVVYNEEKIIERCLESIKGLGDEIILVHDGECVDKTLEIARRYTDQIFIRPHVGDSSLHRVFTYNQARGEWIFQIDADEYIDKEIHPVIREKIKQAENTDINCYRFRWEMWNGKKAFAVRGFQKDCLFRRKHVHYLGITHGWGYVDGRTVDSGLILHHRPVYNNLAWPAFCRKAKKWSGIHAKFYFPEMVTFETFNMDPQKWIGFTEKVRKHTWRYLLREPVKMLLGQLKNGLYTRWTGWLAGIQHSIYYVMVYWKVLKLKNKSKA